MTAYLFDKELELRDGAAAPSTSTHSTAAKALDVLKAGDFKAVIHVTAIDRGTSDETYVFTVQVDSASGFPSPVTVATLPSLVAVGTYELPLSDELIKDFDPAATHIRLTCTIAGTTPSIAYGAYVAPTA